MDTINKAIVILVMLSRRNANIGIKRLDAQSAKCRVLAEEPATRFVLP